MAIASHAEQAYHRWLGELAEMLDDAGTDRYELCRSILTDIYYPQLRDVAVEELPTATQMALLQMDAHNITLEAEYYADIDIDRYQPVKPLIWLWEMFDKSPLGENVELGVLFRRTLAKRIFKSCGSNFKCFHFVKFSYGYNMEVGNGVVVHRHVLLDDRGGIKLGNGVSIADWANIYSHSHALYDGRDVDCPATVIGNNVRITYHATVLAGVHMADNSMLGALAVATKDIATGDVALGIPAQPKLRKPLPGEGPKLPSSTDPLAES
ncbi:MAG TPA: acyltransferase [Longimicrobiales bacterium]|nr:acyltransferase [Longimicrobiales bacterium]